MSTGADLAAARRITVLCVDDHRIVREGLRMVINSEPDMIVIDAAATGAEAVAQYQRHSPDVTLMDLHMPDMCTPAAGACRRTSKPSFRSGRRRRRSRRAKSR